MSPFRGGPRSVKRIRVPIPVALLYQTDLGVFAGSRRACKRVLCTAWYVAAALRAFDILAWVRRAWAAIDAEAAAERTALAPALASETQKARQLLGIAAVLLTLGYSFGDRPFFDRTLAPRLFAFFPQGQTRYDELCSYSYWALAKLVGFGLLPLLHLKLVGARLGDYGLRAAAKSFVLPWRYTYLGLLALILPAVALLSTTRGFQQTYPFYRQTGRSLFDFGVWEVQYLSTFVAVEFFFRGYLLFGLRRILGSLAIFVSMVPYCMVHVLKPPSEALGSIVAGIFLGTLALRTGSIWCGALLHVSVALSMDLFSAWYGHRLPHTLFP